MCVWETSAIRWDVGKRAVQSIYVNKRHGDYTALND